MRSCSCRVKKACCSVRACSCEDSRLLLSVCNVQRKHSLKDDTSNLLCAHRSVAVLSVGPKSLSCVAIASNARRLFVHKGIQEWSMTVSPQGTARVMMLYVEKLCLYRSYIARFKECHPTRASDSDHSAWSGAVSCASQEEQHEELFHTQEPPRAIILRG